MRASTQWAVRSDPPLSRRDGGLSLPPIDREVGGVRGDAAMAAPSPSSILLGEIRGSVERAVQDEVTATDLDRVVQYEIEGQV